jgi:integral membrane protein
MQNNKVSLNPYEHSPGRSGTFFHYLGTRSMGTIHGALFLLFVFNTLSVGVEQKWKFQTTTWKVLLACVILFGKFYIDRKILDRRQTDPIS